MRRCVFFILIGFLAALAACRLVAASDPGKVVEQYLQAKVDGDAEQIHRLLCSELEADLERELHTFESLSGAQLSGVDCQQQGNQPLVQCKGSILAYYGSEQTIFPLGAYRVVVEDGSWKWCGEGGRVP